jgi:hypothetical protein
MESLLEFSHQASHGSPTKLYELYVIDLDVLHWTWQAIPNMLEKLDRSKLALELLFTHSFSLDCGSRLVLFDHSLHLVQALPQGRLFHKVRIEDLGLFKIWSKDVGGLSGNQVWAGPFLVSKYLSCRFADPSKVSSYVFS